MSITKRPSNKIQVMDTSEEAVSHFWVGLKRVAIKVSYIMSLLQNYVRPYFGANHASAAIMCKARKENAMHIYS